jgi:predicted class III extradiol MEMO1 family dioxygenase/AMMECR1 domain-containing protein
MNNYSIFIPHAGELYAGSARKKVFEQVKNIKYIIYLAAIHEISERNFYILHKDDNFDLELNLKKYNKSEHSYEWVEPELNKYYPDALKLVIAPTDYHDKYLGILDKIIKFFNNHDNVLLIATSDLTHYDKSTNDILIYPQQLSKIILEEEIINNLINHKYTKNNIICGPYATDSFCYINKKLNYTPGIVLDYYDSSNYDLYGIDKYVINPTKIINHLVSYVSIIYNKKITSNFDDIIALGIIKSIFLQQLYDKKYEYKLRLPIWSKYCTHNTDHSVFVGTSLNDRVNSCTGSYDYNTSENIIRAANSCIRDSIYRWNNPITLNNINILVIKIDILDSKKDWIELQDYMKEFILDGSYGVYLKLYNGLSATYLPSVAKDYKWTKKSYIESLCEKAGGDKSDWMNKNTRIYTYRVRTVSSD